MLPAVLLDIEGTTTPVTFVYEVLFPYARQAAAGYLGAHVGRDDMAEIVKRLCQEHEEEGSPTPWDETNPGSLADSLARFVHWSMERDRKSTGLKALQGRIWEDGYRLGELEGIVYDDVPEVLARWRHDGRRCSIFSSGSVLAQRLLFRHSNHGDLTPFLEAYFDTTTGPKRQSASYLQIAQALGLSPDDVLFVSDVVEELDAAAAARMGTALCVRPGTAPPDGSQHRTVPDLRGLDLSPG